MFQKWVLILSISILFQIGFAADEMKCYQCDYTDPKCINDLTSLEPKPCTADDKFCYTAVDGDGKLTRGCRKDACTSLSDCQSTETEGGNNHNVCQTCNSSTDKRCAQSNTVEQNFNKICSAKDTKCIVSIKDGNTERRCATDDDVKACTDPNTCNLCPSGNCNNGTFPANRINCYQCDGSADTKCNNIVTNSDDIKSIPCQFYDSKDTCYTYGTNATAMIRGCVSDKDNKCSSQNKDELCQICDGSNCNNVDYMRDQTLKCIKCTGSKTDTSCLWGQDSSNQKNCDNKIVYHQKDTCYTQIVNETIYRGCLYDRNADLGECTADKGCETCNKTEGDGCNNKDMANFTCIVCRSDVEKNCYDDAGKIAGSKCRNAVEYEKRGCFNGVWNNVVIRGCLVDADDRVKATCLNDNNKQCHHCMDKDCNKEKTSSAPNLPIFASVMLLCLAVVIQKL